MGVSESRGCCPTGLSIHVPVYRLFLHESDYNQSDLVGSNQRTITATILNRFFEYELKLLANHGHLDQTQLRA